MWKAYFRRGLIYGIDIYDKTGVDEKRIKTFRGDQTDPSFLHQVASEIGEIDIIIDDGSHISSHVIASFRILFPLLKSGGIYAIEDLQTSYWKNVAGFEWGGSEDLGAGHTSMNFLKSLVDGLNYEEFPSRDYKPSYFDLNIEAIHFYHNLAFICKGPNCEGSTVFGKRESVPGPDHGP